MYIVLVIVVVLIVAWFLFMRPSGKGIRNISTDDLAEMLKDKNGRSFVDVREPHEYAGGHVAGMKNIPLTRLSSRFSELPKDNEVVVMCRSGHRSMMAAKQLKKAGYQNVVNVVGGMGAWHGKVSK